MLHLSTMGYRERGEKLYIRVDSVAERMAVVSGGVAWQYCRGQKVLNVRPQFSLYPSITLED